MLKSRLKNIFQKVLYKMGYYLPAPIIPPRLLLKSIRYKPGTIQRYELKKVTNYARKMNDHNFYEEVLRTFIKTWNIKCSFSSFIGKGRGPYNFNTYRKVEIDGKLYFEKVFFNQAKDLSKTIFFSKEIYPKSSFNFKTPKIKKVFQGDLLTVIYYEFIKLQKINPQHIESLAVKITKELYKVSVKQSINSHIAQFPNYLKTFVDSSFESKKDLNRIETAKKRLTQHEIPVRQLEQLIDTSKKIYAHGDIHEKNIFENEFCIDWDTFGIYPIGTDVGKVYIRLKRHQLTSKGLSKWLEEYYKTTILGSDWGDFKRNIFYLTYIHHYEKYKHYSFFPNLEEEIFEELKNFK